MAVHMRTIRNSFAIVIVAFAAAIGVAQNEKQGTPNDYKWQADATWWFSNPTGNIHGANSSGEFDLARDFGFGSYSTFSGKVDWHFKRKHHLTLRIAPVTSETTRTITRQIEFQGVTYNAGAQITADINTFSIAPGYQYDFIRRDHGYLGGIVQMNLVHVNSSLNGIGVV